MLAGSIILEDLSIIYTVHQEGQQVTYTVCDTMTGKQETLVCNARVFMKALGCALDFDGFYPPEKYHEIEAIQPDDLALRFIP